MKCVARVVINIRCDMNSLLFCVIIIGKSNCLTHEQMKVFVQMNPKIEFVIEVKEKDV